MTSAARNPPAGPFLLRPEPEPGAVHLLNAVNAECVLHAPPASGFALLVVDDGVAHAEDGVELEDDALTHPGRGVLGGEAQGRARRRAARARIASQAAVHWGRCDAPWSWCRHVHVGFSRCGLAGAYGNRTHQRHVSMPLTGFEDRGRHQPYTRSRCRSGMLGQGHISANTEV